MYHASILSKEDLSYTVTLNGNLQYQTSIEDKNDIVGLWKDKPEPFDLERALAGEPVKLRDGGQAFIKYVVPEKYSEDYPVHGYIIYKKKDGTEAINAETWTLNGKFNIEKDLSVDDIVSMWKEPQSEPNTVTLTLPCPLKEPRQEMWYINDFLKGIIVKSNPKEDLSAIWEVGLENGMYFATEADAQAWLDAMRNNRR